MSKTIYFKKRGKGAGGESGGKRRKRRAEGRRFACTYQTSIPETETDSFLTL